MAKDKPTRRGPHPRKKCRVFEMARDLRARRSIPAPRSIPTPGTPKTRASYSLKRAAVLETRVCQDIPETSGASGNLLTHFRGFSCPTAYAASFFPRLLRAPSTSAFHKDAVPAEQKPFSLPNDVAYPAPYRRTCAPCRIAAELLAVSRAMATAASPNIQAQASSFG
ncbi:LAQU0S02e08812g1_1 [Lachancea quebecensis]|uniref:LAQU0S02e08812g1_1 n=1 Tax=Lachancea quebecensis TaxID=1654605 RepID=A0A0P1KN19_9SACH|nr:LAQU0S02e08812g1_1 [Lachancea quebecensis]